MGTMSEAWMYWYRVFSIRSWGSYPVRAATLKVQIMTKRYFFKFSDSFSGGGRGVWNYLDDSKF